MIKIVIKHKKEEEKTKGFKYKNIQKNKNLLWTYSLAMKLKVYVSKLSLINLAKKLRRRNFPLKIDPGTRTLINSDDRIVVWETVRYPPTTYWLDVGQLRD